VGSKLSKSEHIRRARAYELTAAQLTVRGLQHIQNPEPFWTLANVHRAWARKLTTA
jgi:hypothetical protein